MWYYNISNLNVYTMNINKILIYPGQRPSNLSIRHYIHLIYIMLFKFLTTILFFWLVPVNPQNNSLNDKKHIFHSEMLSLMIIIGIIWFQLVFNIFCITNFIFLNISVDMNKNKVVNKQSVLKRFIVH